VYATGPDAVVNVPLEGVEAKLTILNTPSRMAKQKSAQATAARKRKRAERELVVLCIGVGRVYIRVGRETLLFVRDVKTGRVPEEKSGRKARLLLEPLAKSLGLGVVKFGLEFVDFCETLFD
jgi:hypothetical protein